MDIERGYIQTEAVAPALAPGRARNDPQPKLAAEEPYPRRSILGNADMPYFVRIFRAPVSAHAGEPIYYRYIRRTSAALARLYPLPAQPNQGLLPVQ